MSIHVQVRWCGNEAGAADYPNWSTGSSNGGDADSLDWCPAEVDTTLQNADQWFYNPSVGLRSLKVLKDVYHASVGRNGERTSKVHSLHQCSFVLLFLIFCIQHLMRAFCQTCAVQWSLRYRDINWLTMLSMWRPHMTWSMSHLLLYFNFFVCACANEQPCHSVYLLHASTDNNLWWHLI